MFVYKEMIDPLIYNITTEQVSELKVKEINKNLNLKCIFNVQDLLLWELFQKINDLVPGHM